VSLNFLNFSVISVVDIYSSD